MLRRLVIALLLVAAEARADLPPLCQPSRVDPFPNGAAPAPANIPRFFLEETSPVTTVTLEEVDGGAPIALDVSPAPERGSYLRLREPLRVGVAHRLTLEAACPPTGPIAMMTTFTTGPSAPPPTAFGVIRAATVRERTVPGIEALAIEAEIILDASMAPWIQLFRFENLWDGTLSYGDPVHPPQGVSPAGDGVVRATLPVNCNDNSSMRAEKHTLALRARSAMFDGVLDTAPYEVTLECESRSNSTNTDAGHTPRAPYWYGPPPADDDSVACAHGAPRGGDKTGIGWPGFALVGVALLRRRRTRR